MGLGGPQTPSERSAVEEDLLRPPAVEPRWLGGPGYSLVTMQSGAIYVFILSGEERGRVMMLVVLCWQWLGGDRCHCVLSCLSWW